MICKELYFLRREVKTALIRSAASKKATGSSGIMSWRSRIQLFHLKRSPNALQTLQ